MTLPVKLKDIVTALEEAGDQFSHYLDQRTGEIFMISDEEISAAEEGEPVSEYPEWQQESILKAGEILNSNDFVQLPSQFDIHEYSIMERFALGCADRRSSAELLRSIKGRGAFGRFKGTIHDLGIQDEWYEFRQNELEEIAVQWLEQAEIPYTRLDESATTSESLKMN
jgi:hypothetical protein